VLGIGAVLGGACGAAVAAGLDVGSLAPSAGLVLGAGTGLVAATARYAVDLGLRALAPRGAHPGRAAASVALSAAAPLAVVAPAAYVLAAVLLERTATSFGGG